MASKGSKKPQKLCNVLHELKFFFSEAWVHRAHSVFERVYDLQNDQKVLEY